MLPPCERCMTTSDFRKTIRRGQRLHTYCKKCKKIYEHHNVGCTVLKPKKQESETMHRNAPKPDWKSEGEIYLFMNLNEVLGETYYTDEEEVKKMVDEANEKYGGDFWYKKVIPNG